MIRAVIFDLDSCLSAADEVGRDLYAPAFEAIRQASRGGFNSEALDRAFEEMWRIPFDVIAESYEFTPEMRKAGWAAFTQVAVIEPMRGYGDLEVLKELPFGKYLVTSGFRRLQESKIRMLGLEPLMEGIHIDAIDEPNRRGKRGIFEQILRTAGLNPQEVVVVGDNPDSEIEAGNQLGITTIQILRPGVTRDERATHHIHGLAELKAFT